ncbi:MAG: SGNH/GDSL hydrolase family protein [Clostridium sp.]|nr:SGNH/GDSL hydrolase family protein [Clostridium sp.]
MNSIFEYVNLEKIEDKQVVCFGCREAKAFAVRLLEQNICFDYFLFLGDDKYNLPHMLNKQVISIEQLKFLENYVVVAPYNELQHAYQLLSGLDLENNIIEIERLQSKLLSTSNLVIYGTGGRAKRIYREINEYVEVKYFCDSNADKAGSYFEDKLIIHAIALSDLPRDTCVIIGSTYYDEINSTVLQQGIDRNRIFYVEYDLTIFPDNEHSITYKLKSVIDLIRDYKNKELILYGQKNIVYKMSEILLNLGMNVNKIIERDKLEEDGTICSLAYCDMQNVICVIVDKYSAYTHDLLEGIGLSESQYAWVENYSSFNFTCTDRIYKSVLDPHLGHAHISSNEEYPGFIKYECINSESTNPVVILALGGSTTSAYGVRQKPWSEYLSEILIKNSIEHIIYCGGTDSYTASQELIKLIRDGLWLKPDYVISYGGINNMSILSKTPFVHYYQKEFYDGVVKSITSSHWGAMRGVNYGVEPDCDNFKYWFIQIKMMNAICEEFGIGYKAFLQPILYSKERIDSKDADLDIVFLNGCGFLSEYSSGKLVSLSMDETDYAYKLYKSALHFRNMAKKVYESWFCDLSDLFDGQSGIYIDPCHVCGKGNKMIAEKIYGTIKGELKKRNLKFYNNVPHFDENILDVKEEVGCIY